LWKHRVEANLKQQGDPKMKMLILHPYFSVKYGAVIIASASAFNLGPLLPNLSLSHGSLSHS
jgi:hypothetical protein